jgi:hypothetical protein
MSRGNRSSHSSFNRLRKSYLRTESLEPRRFLSGNGLKAAALLDSAVLAYSPSTSHVDFDADAHGTPGVDSLSPGEAAIPEATSATVNAGVVVSAALAPLSAIPVLNSLPGAAATLYLDFNGNYDAKWGGYSNITTPVFDKDGGATTFSDAELTAINDIWQRVSEDYAPFKINVTTVEPA